MEENNEYGVKDYDYDDYVVKKGVVRYKFAIVLFLLGIFFFHPSLMNFTKECLSIENKNILLIIHSGLLASITYLMLKYADHSLILSPCNIEMDIDDYLYYTNEGDEDDEDDEDDEGYEDDEDDKDDEDDEGGIIPPP